MRWLGSLAALVVVLLGILLSPQRAVAATIPMLIACDAEVRSTATVQVEAGPSVRPDRGNAPEYVYGAVHVGYDIAVNPQVVDGVGAVHAYDGALELVERRELGEGPIYDAPAATTAAEGGGLLTEAGAQEIGMLRDAAKGSGNFGIGAADSATATRLGEAWVGDGATVASDGKTLISSDGLRQFRPSSFKPFRGTFQANFEQRFAPQGPWSSNGHLDILFGPEAP